MKPVDLDALASQIAERRRRRRQLGIGLWCAATEARVLGAMLSEPGVLECCAAVETDDFSDLRYSRIFMALRDVQHKASTAGVSLAAEYGPVDLDAVMALLEQRGYHAITWCDLGDLIASTAHYGAHDTTQLAWDITWLRTLATRRSAL